MSSNNEVSPSDDNPRVSVLGEGVKYEFPASPGALLRSVNTHLEKVKQFIEMDYVDFDGSVKRDAVHDSDIGKNHTSDDFLMPLIESEERSFKNNITELDNLPPTSTDDWEKPAVGNSEHSSKGDEQIQAMTDPTLCESEITLPNLESETESEQNKVGDKCEIDLQLQVSEAELPKKNSTIINVVDESASMYENQTNENTCSENNRKLEKIATINEATNEKNAINMQDLREISCEIVNGIVSSIQEEMPASESGRSVRVYSNGTFGTLADITVAFNEDALNEKITAVIKKIDMDSVNEIYTESTGGICNDSFVGDVSSATSKYKWTSTGLASNAREPLSTQGCKPNLVPTDMKQKDLEKSNSNNRDSEHNDKPPLDEDTICGIGNFRPEWLQKWATPRMFLVLYSIIGIIQGTFTFFLITCMSTLEKRFAFKSKVSGGMMAIDEITPLFLGILVGYLGGLSHRPRIVALGMLANVASCFFMVLPYIIYGPAKHFDILPGQNSTGAQLCDLQIQKDMCDSDDRPPTISAVAMFLFACFLKGFSNLAYYVVGLSYMDDNSKKKNTAFYLGIAFALRLFGPTLGFLMSSVFLKIYENPFEDPGYGPDDPRWIGGWWMGFMFQGILLLLFTLPIAMFPRRLPNHPPIPRTFYDGNQTWIQKFAGLIPALKRLSKNPLFLFLCFNTIMSILGSFGHFVMLPKYMEYQFRLTASEASLYSGPPGLITLQVVTVVGGFLIWKFRPTAKFLTGGMVLSELFLAVGFLVLMIPKCEKIDLSNIGFTSDGSLKLQNECNADCMCTTASFTPLCGPDDKTTYFSPCHAGCTESRKISNDNEIYNNCSCVTDELGRSTTAYHLKKGFCVEEGCWSQALAYIILLPVFYGISSILKVSHTMVLLRSTAPEDKSVALGTIETLACLFGFIPYPILFGAIVDSSCIVWEQSCGKTGNCWFYDMEKFNYLLHGVSASFSFLSALSLVAIYFLSTRLKDLYEDEVLEEKNADGQIKEAYNDVNTKC